MKKIFWILEQNVMITTRSNSKHNIPLLYNGYYCNHGEQTIVITYAFANTVTVEEHTNSCTLVHQMK
uniref:Uncharacterized protein n=1 Tax=Setaria italica TaxID=4555 RepID=K3XP22_SETIT